jgi:protein gp37
MGGMDVQVWPKRLDQPRHTRKPSVVFVAPMGDLFHEDVPDEFIRRVLSNAAVQQRHRYIVLSKRAERMAEFAAKRYPVCGDPDLLGHIWFGVSCEDQATADERVPLLLVSGWPNLWVSAEPLLGPVSLKPWLAKLGQVIIGCESGAGARPCPSAWCDALTGECYEVGVPCYLKQWRGASGVLCKRAPSPCDVVWSLEATT